MLNVLQILPISSYLTRAANWTYSEQRRLDLHAAKSLETKTSSVNHEINAHLT